MNSDSEKNTKINQTENAAYLLYDQGYFDSCINRFYYCVYQRVIKYMEENDIPFENRGMGSHNSTIVNFSKEIYKDRKIDELSFTNNFMALKENRKMADYKLHKLEKNTANKVKSIFKILMEELDEMIGRGEN